MMSDAADWSDHNTRIVCELFAEQVRANNRSGTHLNRLGYNAVIAKFSERTGLQYTQQQFKNRWEKLRKEYGHWKLLAKETGVGWDPERKTYMASNDWWKKANKQYKGIAKFKDRGLQNEAEFSIMFEDLRNTGEDHWTPASGTMPQSPKHENCPANLFESGGNEKEKADDGSDCEDITPTSVKGKRPQPITKGKNKKPKTSGGHWMQERLDKIVALHEKTSESCESLARREDTSGCSIKDVMALVKESGALVGSKEHFIASQIFTKRAEREMFMTLETPEERLQWLTMKYEWTTKKDLP